MMSKNLSDNTPVLSSQKKHIKNFPTDDRYVTPHFDMIYELLGKYISKDEQSFIVHQNNLSKFNTLDSEILLLRYSDSVEENKLESAQKVCIDIRYFPNGNFKILGQVDQLHGEYSYHEEVRKELIVSAQFWKRPYTMKFYLNEYQIYDISFLGTSISKKRKLLCQTTYYFYQDVEEDYIEKVDITIKDDKKKLCFHKTYNKVDRKNRRFFTNQ